MMKKTNKLKLEKETIRRLASRELDYVVGGAGSIQETCGQCYTGTCTPDTSTCDSAACNITVGCKVSTGCTGTGCV